MKARLFTLLAAGLLALGAFAAWLFQFQGSQPRIAAAAGNTGVAAARVTSISSSAAAIDAATEGAYAAASPSIVYVVNPGIGSGSGIIYDTNGDIVTNNHVVSGATSLRVTLNNGRSYTASVVGTSRAEDLAVIRIHASNLTPAKFASATGYHVAETVLAIGSPLGLKQSVTSGLISGVHRVVQEPNGVSLTNTLQTSAPINPGNSGGALVALDGTVVGIPTLEQTSSSDGTTAQNVGFAIASDRVVTTVNQLIAA
jgi:putative serine protease PepD